MLVFAAPSFAALPTVALFYGEHPPINQLQAYDVVVVDPSADISPLQFNSANSQLFAYVSVGEVEKTLKIPAKWVAGTNPIWKANVVDQTNLEWQHYFLENIIEPLWAKGYRGFFLDTLDSYQLIAHDKQSQQQQIDALVKLIKSIKSRHPQAQLIFNRGFELLPATHNLVFAVAAESLFSSWNQQYRIYQPVQEKNRIELLNQLKIVQNMGLPVIVIDYVSPNDNQQARTIARRIAALNMIPWVTDGALEKMGIGAITPVPRKIFVIYSVDLSLTVFDASAFNRLGMPLEYLGYVPEYHDMSAKLPDTLSTLEYAGIIIWGSTDSKKVQQQLYVWVLQRMQQHIPIIFMDDFPFEMTRQSLAPFGLEIDEIAPDNTAVKITEQNKSMVGFEIQPYPNQYDFFPIKATKGQVFLQITNAHQQREDAIAITPWGGYALGPYTILALPNDNTFWVLNPLPWLQKALRLATFPAPDTTTENGRRLMMVHIDGDGFVSRAEWRDGNFASVELENRILKRYQIPTTVSVIVGDLAPSGLFPKLSAQLMAIARDIFKLPWVEIASHTYSHPFDWQLVAKYPVSGKYNLPIPNYHFKLATEITGSIDFINRYLAPPDKHCKVLLWSGYGNAGEAAVKLTYEDKVANVNGGDTNITNSFPSISRIGPLGMYYGPYFQVFTPISNEEYYTNSWLGPFYGFLRVIETFKLTDSPQRFKPIDIYYHFYSATKEASLMALNTVYQWALSQSVFNIFESDFFEKILDFNRISIVIRDDGGWQIRSHAALRELRAPLELGYPDLERSTNLVGYSVFNHMNYLHLGPAQQSIVYFSKKLANLPYLQTANGRVTKFERSAKGLLLHMQGYLPLQFVLNNMQGCQVQQEKTFLKAKQQSDNEKSFILTSTDSGDLYVKCN